VVDHPLDDELRGKGRDGEVKALDPKRRMPKKAPTRAAMSPAAGRQRMKETPYRVLRIAAV